MADNEIRHDCGHTDSEHADQFAEVLSALFGMPVEIAREAAADAFATPAVDEMADIVIYDVLYAVTRPGNDQDITTTRVVIGKTSNHITSVQDIPKIIAVKLGVPVEWVTVLDRRAVSNGL